MLQLLGLHSWGYELKVAPRMLPQSYNYTHLKCFRPAFASCSAVTADLRPWTANHLWGHWM